MPFPFTNPSTSGELKILDFDMETRKVGFHNGGRFKPDGCEPVVLAASWHGEDAVNVWSLSTTWKEKDLRKLLEGFVELFNEADIVTGHYISKFDLPIINGSLLEFGYEPLDKKLMVDTKTDLVMTAGLSQSQENLSSLKQLDSSKFHMNDNMWRSLCRLTPEGLELARTRVTTDIAQHKELYSALQPWLGSPKHWAW